MQARVHTKSELEHRRCDLRRIRSQRCLFRVEMELQNRSQEQKGPLAPGTSLATQFQYQQANRGIQLQNVLTAVPMSQENMRYF